MGALKPWHLIILLLVLLMVAAVVTVIVLIIVAIVRRSERGRPTGGARPSDAGAPGTMVPPVGAPVTQETAVQPPAEDPRAILDRRLARGEISPEEHERLRRIIEGPPGPGERTS